MKNYCVRLLVACAMSLVANSGFAAIGDGLVSYWPLDGNISDSKGSNHGTFNGTDTTAVYDGGKYGQGIDLDGVDQSVDVGNDASLDMSVAGGGTGSVSISAWLRVDGFDKSWQGLVAKGEGEGVRIARRGGGDVLAYAGGSGDIPGEGEGPNVNDGGLHHVVGVSENGVSTRLWVDGTLVATGDAPTINNAGNVDGSNPPLLIGDNPQTDPNRSWNGLIDDVAIWNRALTADEVATIYNGSKSLQSKIPEPSALLLIGSGMGLLLGMRRSR